MRMGKDWAMSTVLSVEAESTSITSADSTRPADWARVAASRTDRMQALMVWDSFRVKMMIDSFNRTGSKSASFLDAILAKSSETI